MNDGYSWEEELRYLRQKRQRILRRNSPFLVIRYYLERFLIRPNQALPMLIKIDKQISFIA